MEKLIFTDYKVVAMNNRSLTFEINGEYYFACKRVANQILEGERDCVFAGPVISKTGKEYRWLATPSRF